MKNAVLVLSVVLLVSSLSVAMGAAQRPQPGATQGGADDRQRDDAAVRHAAFPK